MVEDYVSFETAKLLKEKGFDIPLNYFYNSDGRKCYATSYNWNQTTGDFQDYSCPTLQMAMKWLREKHKIFISIQQHMDMSYVWYSYEDGAPKGCDRESHNNTYEQACEAAIKYCLEKLI